MHHALIICNVIKDIENNGAFLIEIAVPRDTRVDEKEQEKADKYQDLAKEITRLWKVEASDTHRHCCFGSDTKRSEGEPENTGSKDKS